MGYHRAGFEVVGVDIAPQPNYPFEFHQGDALEFLSAHGGDFDAIHASPPCQAHLNLGSVNRALGRDYDHADLVAVTMTALAELGKPYVVENVENARRALGNALRICGTGLGLPLRRHRWFASDLMMWGVECEHERFNTPRYWTGWRPHGEQRLSMVVQVYGNAGGRSEWAAAMGIDWMTPEEMTEAIPPAYTEHIGRQLIEHLARAAA